VIAFTGGNAIAEKVIKLRLEREPGYLYFIDKEGDISRILMARDVRKNTAGGKNEVEKNSKKNLKRLLKRNDYENIKDVNFIIVSDSFFLLNDCDSCVDKNACNQTPTTSPFPTLSHMV
jgi:hypothetical protein